MSALTIAIAVIAVLAIAIIYAARCLSATDTRDSIDFFALNELDTKPVIKRLRFELDEMNERIKRLEYQLDGTACVMPDDDVPTHWE